MSARECDDSELTNNHSNECVEQELCSPVVGSDEVEEASSNVSLLVLRVLNIIMSITSFSVMSKVEYISSADFDPIRSCKDRYSRGTFNYRAYQAVLSVGVIVCFVNILLLLHYMIDYTKSWSCRSRMNDLYNRCKMNDCCTCLSIQQ